MNPFKGYPIHAPIHPTFIKCMGIGMDASWSPQNYTNDNAKTWDLRRQIIALNPFKGLSIQAPIDTPSNRCIGMNASRHNKVMDANTDLTTRARRVHYNIPSPCTSPSL